MGDDAMESAINNNINGDTSSSFAVNRSGLIRKTQSTKEIGTQTEVDYNFHQGSRNFNDSIKIALARSCAAAKISPHLARVSFQTTSFLGLTIACHPMNGPRLIHQQIKN